MTPIKQMREEIETKMTAQDVLAIYNIYPNRACKIKFQREERTKSVHVYTDHLYDFGTNRKYSLIDITMEMENISYVAAVKKLYDHIHIGCGNKIKTNEIKKIKKKNEVTFEFTEFKNIKDPRKYQEYLEQRYLPNTNKILKRFGYQLGEIQIKKYKNLGIKYSNTHCIYFNPDNTKFKGQIGQSNISFFNRNADSIGIFEGWADTIAYYEMMLHKINKGLATNRDVTNAICLNSVSNTNIAINFLDKHKYNKISFWLDNDPAGHDAALKMFDALDKKNFEGEIEFNNIKYAACNDWAQKWAIIAAEKKLKL
ncbi:MAG: hypothetical protein ATN35_02080 [Epulopiscium sp. Nele67-Bin004]|nr:MAG: hypothetical protein ATN35_02080 [Epulopiscium sp. Nele67-Bin004]